MPYCPDREVVAATIQALLPPGKAWQNHDASIAREDSVMKSFFYGLSQSFLDVETAICSAWNELFCSTAEIDLDLWLEDYGLPDETDPLGINLCAKVSAEGGTTTAYYEGLASFLGWSTEMRWLKGDDLEYPGVVSTLFVLIDITTSEAAGEITDLGNWEIGLSPLGFPDPETLIAFLEKLLPAHCAILWDTWESAPVIDSDDEEFFMHLA